MTTPKKLFTVIVLCLAFSAPVMTLAASGNDFVDTELRVDISAVSAARDYSTYIYAAAQPTSSSCCWTNGWLGLDLNPFNGTTYSAQFSQVGLQTSNAGLQWFVYAEPGVQCLRGTPAWGPRGCIGAVGDLVTMNQWSRVELVTYGQGFWVIRVYEPNGTAHDVAHILSSSLTIYRANQVSEEGYYTPDPFLTMSFYHWHPMYMVPGRGFMDWPASGSTGAHNYLSTIPSTICQTPPGHYGAHLALSGDPRYWWDGSVTGSYTCISNPQF